MEPQEPIQLPVLYRDERFVAVHKPCGLFTHPSSFDGGQRQTCLSILRDQLGRYVYPIHRLDRATSGVLLFALSSDAAAEASHCFQNHTARKIYQALVRGYVEEQGEIHRPLKKLYGKGSNSGKVFEAITQYRRLRTFEINVPMGRHQTSRYSLVEVLPLTGRLHQIRRHMASISHHLIGDTVYGDGKHNRLFRERYGFHRLALAATDLWLPLATQTLRIQAPLGDDFEKLIEQVTGDVNFN